MYDKEDGSLQEVEVEVDLTRRDFSVKGRRFVRVRGHKTLCIILKSNELNKTNEIKR